MKRKITAFIVFLLFYMQGFSQTFWERSHIGVGFWGMKYLGDVTNSYTRFAAQGTFTYELTDHFNLRGQLLLGSIGASDADAPAHPSDDPTSVRPHPFSSRIQEINALAEYDFLGHGEETKWTPYAMAGLGYFNYNPKHDGQIWLRNSKNVDIPLGGGIKYFLNYNITFYGEGNFRFSFVDDVDGLRNYGNSRYKDAFYSLMVGVLFRFGGSGNNGNTGKSGKTGSRMKGCPPVYL